MGNRLRKLIRSKGFTQSQFARVVGIEKHTISNLITGRNDPRLSTLKIIAEYFGVSLDYLVYGKEDTNGFNHKRRC